jgi:hypothetical protein
VPNIRGAKPSDRLFVIAAGEKVNVVCEWAEVFIVESRWTPSLVSDVHQEPPVTVDGVAAHLRESIELRGDVEITWHRLRRPRCL